MKVKQYFLIFISLSLLSNVIEAQNPEGFDQMVKSYLSETVPSITPNEIADKNYIFLDARSKEEFDVSHLPNAIYIGYDEINWNAVDTVNKDKPIVVYCSIGYRSEKVGEQLMAKGYQNVYNLYGGIFNWANNDFPVYKGINLTNEVHGYAQRWAIWLDKDKITIVTGDLKLIDMWDNIINSYKGFAGWVFSEVTFQTEVWYQNYFLWLLVISAIVFGLEIIFPWRKNQKIFRKDFWMDFTYMFLNFYVFAFFLTGFYVLIGQLIAYTGVDMSSYSLLDLSKFPIWSALLIFFIANDFVQWFTHYLLHKYPFLWEFHKVHHSVKEMGFAAHLRYHWMENVLYKPLKTLVVIVLFGVEPQIAFIVHFFSIAIGHLNHANLNLDYGPFKYILNNPKMHIWHHAKELPKDFKNGMNFGISLSIWDYIFKTAHIPSDGRDIELGFDDDENFPKTILEQSIYPLNKKK